jgi:hypothetical protein
VHHSRELGGGQRFVMGGEGGEGRFHTR